MLDWINGSFELVGGLLCWLNFKQLLKDKKIDGVYWPVTAFFTLWGIWNLYYYPQLGQIISFIGGIFLVLGNLSWVCLAIYYTYGVKTNET
jgi:hypothetical protein